MPVKIPNRLPARRVLEDENIFVMTESRALHQDIRPLKILILNLMPTKITTETQLMRCLSNTPLQIEIDLLQTSTYTPKNTSAEHLLSFYCCFEDIRNERYDGMIITGAPLENMEFEQVNYWSELCEIMEWSKTNVHSTLHICWGAQAALYYHYHIPKYALDQKLFGIFPHTPCQSTSPLLRGFDDIFYAPHSRHTANREEDIRKVRKLEILAKSEEAGPYLVATRDGRHIFLSGHPEYDPDTLAGEYFRDLEKGLPIAVPKNYFTNDDPQNPPLVSWRSHAHLLYTNWLNYYVYQTTPYDRAHELQAKWEQSSENQFAALFLSKKPSTMALPTKRVLVLRDSQSNGFQAHVLKSIAIQRFPAHRPANSPCAPENLLLGKRMKGLEKQLYRQTESSENQFAALFLFI